MQRLAFISIIRCFRLRHGLNRQYTVHFLRDHSLRQLQIHADVAAVIVENVRLDDEKPPTFAGVLRGVQLVDPETE